MVTREHLYYVKNVRMYRRRLSSFEDIWKVREGDSSVRSFSFLFFFFVCPLSASFLSAMATNT